MKSHILIALFLAWSAGALLVGCQSFVRPEARVFPVSVDPVSGATNYIHTTNWTATPILIPQAPTAGALPQVDSALAIISALLGGVAAWQERRKNAMQRMLDEVLPHVDTERVDDKIYSEVVRLKKEKSKC